MSERFEHTMSEALTINNVDPDDGNDWKCNACGLPIFSTPFIDNPNGHTQGRTRPLRSAPGHMHEQCANKIPAKLEKHPLHPMAELTLQHVQPDDDDNNTHDYYCSRCGLKCGSKFYKCGDEFCGFTLDLACALAIKIVHQSHRHELTAMMGSLSCSFICCACGTRHDPPPFGEWGVSYVCSPCDFWLHPDCAVLPNAIEVDDDDDKAVVHHDHPLLLSYRIGKWSAARSDFKSCAICGGGGGDDSKGLGWYRCFHCDYSAHIKCIVYSDPHPQRFKPVLLRDAKFPGLIHLPMANEHQSVVQRIMNSTAGTIDCAISTSSNSYNNKVHQHPLVINQLLRNNNNNDDDNNNNNNNNDDDDDDCVCNACVQLISPFDAFYSCCKVINSCRDFFLHSCCAQLPDEITTRRCSGGWKDDHTLSLLVEAVGNKFPFHRSVQDRNFISKSNIHNGFAYFCKVCHRYIDVINALMPASITHDAHVKSHILCITYTYRLGLICSCCKRITDPIQIGYECNNCNNFYIHMDCALLPDMVTHDFDRHPLKLITTSTSLRDHHQQQGEEEEELPLCEICEQDMYTGRWFYGCKKCDQSFHVDCMPYFDHLSKIKFGFTIRVTEHVCPLACVRALSVQGYKCAHCHLVIMESDEIVFKWREYYSGYKIAFECAECDYRIHGGCAKKLLLKA